MAIFLRLRAGILLDSGVHQQLCQRIANLRRIHQICLRNAQVSIILKHAGIPDLRHHAAVKLIKGLIPVKGHGNLKGAVTAEIEENHAVAVLHFADRLAILGNDKGGKVLINRTGFIAERLNRFMRRSKLPSDSVHMGVPSQLYHRPVCLITVHGNHHASAA